MRIYTSDPLDQRTERTFLALTMHGGYARPRLNKIILVEGTSCVG